MTDGSGTAPSTILLIPPHPSLVHRLPAGDAGGDPTGWMYLGSDPVAAFRMQEAFGPSIPRIDITATLQETARRHRQAYIDFIGGLSPRPCSLPWLLTSLSEKNPFTSSFYLSFCSIAACREHLGKAAGTVIVVCGSPGIRDALAGALAGGAYGDVRCVGQFPHPLTRKIRTGLAGSVRTAWFVVRYLGRILLARLYHRLRAKDAGSRPGTVYLHAWTDQRSFRTPGSYGDIFYGDLVPLLSPGAPCCYLIDVLPTMGYVPALLRLRQVRHQDHVLQEYYLRPSDILGAIRAARGSYRGMGPVPTLERIPAGPLIAGDVAADAATARQAQSYLCYLAGRRLAASTPMAAFVYTFENQIWEKCALAGIREGRAGIRTVGYAHAIVNANNLSYSYSRREEPCMPLPDVILANGEEPRRVLSAAGFPPDRIRVGGALRYEALTTPAPPARPVQGRTVVLAGSVSIPRTIELVTKAVLAFRGDPDLPVRIKCHPTLPYRYLQSRIPPLPPHFSIADGPPQDLLDSAGLVLFTESTLAVEAAARGIPVIHVKSDCTIDINIFEGIPLVPSVTSPEELRAVAMDLLQHPQTDLREVREYITGLFSPVNPPLIRSLVVPEGSPTHPTRQGS
ncbi:MAG: hypothetical protein LUQ64_01375 [Methanomicrobiales archaeon]|nr:hypothetical protein [Methanomicrobiales archaeon]